MLWRGGEMGRGRWCCYKATWDFCGEQWQHPVFPFSLRLGPVPSFSQCLAFPKARVYKTVKPYCPNVPVFPEGKVHNIEYELSKT